MSKTRRWFIILLILAVLVLIGINLTDKEEDHPKTINTTSTPTYKSDHSDTVIYNSEGVLKYRLVAQHVEHFSEEGSSWFTQPVITTFNTNSDKIPAVPIWLIKSDKAKLTNDYMLYLYGHVEVNALTSDNQLRKITTYNAQINLVTQDMVSQGRVTLYGKTFNSSGLRMRGNLRNKKAQLIKKVRTSYEIQNR